ncbi:hypothetical protein [Nocardiopsis dassonvillei]|uniref:hypothetical protein n=1 Tax=Nocardiopsis dassonvillei TaxID=2014 RepID=UPI003F568889
MSEHLNDARDPRPDRVTERPVARECAWCGDPIQLRPRARHQRYCSRGCRQRAYEVRTAASRQQADQAAGRARTEDEPVREVLERVTVRTARSRRPPALPPVVREVPVVAAPTKGRQVSDFLDAAAAAVADGTIPRHDLRRVHTSAHRLFKALDQAYPGGLNALRKR